MEIDPKATPPIDLPKTETRILDLPSELLLLLLTYLDLKSLARLALVSKGFFALARDSTLWNRLLRSTVCASASNAVLPFDEAFERCRVALKLSTGKIRCEEVIAFSLREIPCLRIEDGHLYSTNNSRIDRRRLPSNRETRAEVVFKGLLDCATRFVVKDGLLTAGGTSGCFASWLIEDEREEFTRFNSYLSGRKKKKKERRIVESRFPLFRAADAHASSVDCVDAHADLVVSGSRDRSLKLWRREGDPGRSVQLLRVTSVEDRVWSVAFSPSGDAFVSGAAGIDSRPSPLKFWSVETGVGVSLRDVDVDFRRGAGILHASFESPDSLVTSGYDSCVRVWDARTLGCVARFDDPFDYTVFSVCSDATRPWLFAGTQYYGLVQLWDRRRTDKPVRTIYSVRHRENNEHSTPIYSMALNGNEIFVGFDSGVGRIDFDAADNSGLAIPSSFRF